MTNEYRRPVVVIDGNLSLRLLAMLHARGNDVVVLPATEETTVMVDTIGLFPPILSPDVLMQWASPPASGPNRAQRRAEKKRR